VPYLLPGLSCLLVLLPLPVLRTQLRCDEEEGEGKKTTEGSLPTENELPTMKTMVMKSTEMLRKAVVVVAVGIQRSTH